MVGRIQRSEVYFDLVSAAGENRRAAVWAEEAPAVVAGFASDRHRILREYCRGIEQRAMMLATVQAMTKANPVGVSCGDKTYVAA